MKKRYPDPIDFVFEPHEGRNGIFRRAAYRLASLLAGHPRPRYGSPFVGMRFDFPAEKPKNPKTGSAMNGSVFPNPFEKS